MLNFFLLDYSFQQLTLHTVLVLKVRMVSLLLPLIIEVLR